MAPARASTDLPLVTVPGREARRRALRKGARVAVAASTAFYAARFGLGNAQVAVFATLAVIALLSVADFGGRAPARARAYAIALACGLALVALGTPISDDTPVATALTFVVTLAIGLVARLGRGAATGATALILLFVVSCGIPAAASALPDRLLGVAIGGVLSLLAALLLWPDRPEQERREALARAYGELAQGARRLSADRDAGAERREARAAAEAALPWEGADADRPSGTADRDRAIRRLAEVADRLLVLLARMRAATPPHGPPDADRALLDRLGDALDGVAAALAPPAGGRAPDPAEILSLAQDYRARTESELAESLLAGEAQPRLAADAQRSVAGVGLAAGAALAARESVPASGGPAAEAIDGPFAGRGLAAPPSRGAAVAARLRALLTPGSVALHDALRLALALAVARGVAGAFELKHGFWVVFATLIVVRTNAVSTRATAAQALAGTLTGAAAGVGIIVASGGGTTFLAAILPLVIAIAVTGAAFGTIGSQAGFTVLIIVLFSIVRPTGWELGLLRVEDVLVGLAIGIAIGLFTWPRGAAAQLSRAIAAQVEAAGAYLSAATLLRLGHGDRGALEGLRRAASDSIRRADDTLTVAVTERPRSGAMERYADVLVAGRRLWLAADLMAARPVTGADLPAGGGALLASLSERAEGFAVRCSEIAAAIRAGRTAGPADPAPPTLELTGRSATLAERAAGRDAASARSTARLLRTRAWVLAAGDDVEALARAATRAGRPGLTPARPGRVSLEEPAPMPPAP